MPQGGQKWKKKKKEEEKGEKKTFLAGWNKEKKIKLLDSEMGILLLSLQK